MAIGIVHRKENRAAFGDSDTVAADGRAYTCQPISV